MWPGPKPTSTPSGIPIHPIVWPQYTNVTERQIDRTYRQRSDRIWLNGRPKMVWLSPGTKNNERPGNLLELRSCSAFSSHDWWWQHCCRQSRPMLMSPRVQLRLRQLTFTAADGMLHPRQTCPFCQTWKQYCINRHTYQSPTWNRPTRLT